MRSSIDLAHREIVNSVSTKDLYSPGMIQNLVQYSSVQTSKKSNVIPVQETKKVEEGKKITIKKDPPKIIPLKSNILIFYI